MELLEAHRLSMLSSLAPEQTGSHLARFLADTRVSPLGACDRPTRVGGLRIGGFSIALIESPGPMEMEAVISGDHFLILSCLRGAIRMEVDGAPIVLDAGHGVVTRPRRRLRAQFSRDSARLAVRIDPHLPGPDLFPEHHVFGIDSPEMQPWFESMRFLISSPAFQRIAAEDPVLVQNVEGVLFRLLHSTPIMRMLRGPASPAVSSDVRRAEAFIRAHAARDLTLAKIAASAEVSARTLQSNFVRYRNMSPMQYLRNVRLDRAHELLQGGKKVAEAAFECGFAHQGRFAIQYRARFGETPSTTARRAG